MNLYFHLLVSSISLTDLHNFLWKKSPELPPLYPLYGSVRHDARWSCSKGYCISFPWILDIGQLTIQKFNHIDIFVISKNFDLLNQVHIWSLVKWLIHWLTKNVRPVSYDISCCLFALAVSLRIMLDTEIYSWLRCKTPANELVIFACNVADRRWKVYSWQLRASHNILVTWLPWWKKPWLLSEDKIII